MKGESFRGQFADFDAVAVVYGRYGALLCFEAEIAGAQFEPLMTVIRAAVHILADSYLDAVAFARLGGRVSLPGGKAHRLLLQVQRPVVFVIAALYVNARQARMCKIAVEQGVQSVFAPVVHQLIRVGIARGNAFGHSQAGLAAGVCIVHGIVG